MASLRSDVPAPRGKLQLGLKLFQRESKCLMLTDPGRSYLEVVPDAFDPLAAGTASLLQRENAGVLTVRMSPNFAAKCLIHRLRRAAAADSIDFRYYDVRRRERRYRR